MNRLREAREYCGISVIEAAIYMGSTWIKADVLKVEIDDIVISEYEWTMFSCLYCRPVAWLKGEPAPPVEIDRDLDRLMEDLSDQDRSEVVRFAEFLTHRKATP